MSWHDEMKNEIKKKAVKVAHNNKTADDGYDAKKLDLVVALYAAGEIIGDGAMKFYYQEACDCDGDATKEPTEVECPLHKQNYNTTKPCMDWVFLVK